jgi:adenylate cyclase
VSGANIRQRLAAILAADAAGYSRLMALDERATLASLDSARETFRSQIEANRGRVVDMAGDSVMAIFETASGAVTAAVAIQAQLTSAGDLISQDRSLPFRIGVHLGDVIEKSDGTIYGDGVNIAARLQGLAEAGGIAVSESVRTAVKGKLETSFQDLGEQTVKNIADPIRVYRLRNAGDEIRPRAPSTIAAIDSSIDLSLPDKRSIAVLAFTNMSGDPGQEFFTDGISEDIITELSRFRALFVIARNSSFTYKNTSVDVRRVGRELGVRYVLEGSIRRSNDRVRITAQLSDSQTGQHVWAEKYDRVLEDVFKIQEEVTQCIVASVAPSVNSAEVLKVRHRPGNVTAYEIALRAEALVVDAWQRGDQAARDEALAEARRALHLDASNITALETIAHAQWQNTVFASVPDVHAAWKEGMAAMDRAIRLAGASTSHAVKALLLAYAPGNTDWQAAIIEAKTALEINPQDSVTVVTAAHLLSNAGDPVTGIGLLERWMRISPRDPYGYNAYAQLGMCYFILAEYGKSVDWALKALGMAPGYVQAHMLLTASLAGLGDMVRARNALETMRKIAPAFVESRLRGHVVMPESEHRNRYVGLLRSAAGMG